MLPALNKAIRCLCSSIILGATFALKRLTHIGSLFAAVAGVGAILLSSPAARAQSIPITTVTVLVTNTCSNNMSITVNGVTRTWQTIVVNGSIQIATATNTASSATNLYLAYATVTQPNLLLQFVGSNQVNFQSFPGQALSVSVFSNWATLGTNVQYLTNYQVVRVPFGPNADGSNSASGIALGMQYSTNAMPTNTVATSLLEDLFNKQTNSGAKLFTGANNFSNASQMFQGGTVSNVTVAVTNGWLLNVLLTNGINYGNAFSSPGPGSFDEQLGAGAVATNGLSLAVGHMALAGGNASTALGDAANALGQNSTALGTGADVTSTGTNGIALGTLSTVSANNGMALGANAAVAAGQSNSVAIGTGAATTAANQILLGGSGINAVVQNILQVLGSLTNSTFTGTNNFQGDAAFSQQVNTSLATGNNAAVSPGSGSYIKVSGPSGAFTIAGLVGGRDGRWLILENASGQTMNIANDSGLDPAATNRIYTGVGADVLVTTSPGFALFIYDISVTHWKLITAGGTGGSVSATKYDPVYFNTNAALQISAGPAGTLWTNFANSVGTASTNYSVAMGQVITNYINATVPGSFNGTPLTNWIGILSTNGSNYAALTVGQTITNWAGVLSTNSTNFIGTLSTNATNYVQFYSANLSTNDTNFAKTIGTTITNAFVANAATNSFPSTNALAPNNLTNFFAVSGGGITLSQNGPTNTFTVTAGAFNGAPLTNWIGTLLTNGSNYTATLSTNATNFTYSIGANDTNYASAQATAAQANAQSYAAQLGVSLTNSVQLTTSNYTVLTNCTGSASNLAMFYIPTNALTDFHFWMDAVVQSNAPSTFYEGRWEFTIHVKQTATNTYTLSPTNMVDQFTNTLWSPTFVATATNVQIQFVNNTGASTNTIRVQTVWNQNTLPSWP